MTRVLAYLQRNALATLALALSVLALAGASYAAFSLPANSVGSRQIRNHSIGAQKLDPSSIAASVRAWAVIQWGAGNKLVAKSTSERVRVGTGGTSATITWPHRRFARNCMPSITPEENRNTKFGVPDYITAQFDPTNPSGAFLSLLGFAADGTRGPQAAYVMIVCP